MTRIEIPFESDSIIDLEIGKVLSAVKSVNDEFTELNVFIDGTIPNDSYEGSHKMCLVIEGDYDNSKIAEFVFHKTLEKIKSI